LRRDGIDVSKLSVDHGAKRPPDKKGNGHSAH
jgi:hypothetical protein